MASEDKIVIDGVEYEQCDDVSNIQASCTTRDTRGDFKLIAIRPKRKQTGWICKACSTNPMNACYKLYPIGPPSGCLGDEYKVHPSVYRPDWQPFYGKVVE